MSEKFERHFDLNKGNEVQKINRLADGREAAKAGNQPCRANLVPRIKLADFAKQVEAGMNQKNATGALVVMPYTVPLAADLVIAFAFQLGHTYAFASPEMIEHAGIPLNQVMKVALQNLEARVPQIAHAEMGPIRHVITGSNMESCMLLIKYYWRSIKETMGGEIVAAVPNRDTILFCDSAVIGAVDTLREMIPIGLRSVGGHPLSKRLLVYRNDSWHEYEGEGGMRNRLIDPD